MERFQELRYPFESFIEFVSGGYWSQTAALHLLLGFVVLVALTIRLGLSRTPLLEKLIILHFASAIFNNPAYSLAGLRFGELSGVFAALMVLWTILGRGRVETSRVGVPLIVAGVVILCYSSFVQLLYPELGPDMATQVLRAVVTAKIALLGIVIVGMERTFTPESYQRLMRQMVIFATAATLLYLVQAGVFLSGTIPYGTYWDAGFTGVPSFGAVSIERGHFGKFLVPVFPFFLYMSIRFRWRVAMLLFVVVNLVNFSASALTFLVGYLALSAFNFRRQLARPSTAVALVAVGAVFIALGARFSEQYMGIIQKIIDLGFNGDDAGGRGVSVLMDYLHKYPLGTGYGGSTVKVPDLPESNMGAFVLLSQLSLLSAPLVAGFIWLVFRAVKCAERIEDRTLRAALMGGAIMPLFIGFTDVLWFVPTLWAPIVIADGLTWSSRRALEATAEPFAHAAMPNPGT